MPDPNDKSISRRTFLKGAIGAAGGAAAGLAVPEALEAASASAEAPLKQGKEVASICPYCAVGCGQIVMVDGQGKIIDIQGNPNSPINQGTLCPKGSATLQLVTNANRWTKVKYRAPGSDHWEDKPLDWAMDRIAQLVKAARDGGFNETQAMPDGKGGTAAKKVMNTYALASLGGATMDNEWNYIHQKLMHALGVVYVENQARI